MIKVKFFAQLRERLDCDELNYDLNSTVSVGWLLSQLAQQGERWEEGLKADSVLVAVNHTLCGPEASVHRW